MKLGERIIKNISRGNRHVLLRQSSGINPREMLEDSWKGRSTAMEKKMANFPGTIR